MAKKVTLETWATTLHLLSNLSARKGQNGSWLDQTFLRHYKREKGRVNSSYSGRRAKNIITQSGNKRREIGLDLPAAVIIGENKGARRSIR